MSPQQEEENDWEITPEGLYIATRGFLSRRGYCCANRCRNCPYINWRDDPAWRPIAPERVRRTRVSEKALAAARAMFLQHKYEAEHGPQEQRLYHLATARHYHHLLECWKS